MVTARDLKEMMGDISETDVLQCPVCKKFYNLVDGCARYITDEKIILDSLKKGMKTRYAGCNSKCDLRYSASW